MKVRIVKRGTTLFEILVVFAILALLMIVTYPVIKTQITKALDARVKADLYKIKINLEIYYSLAEQFPRELPACGQPLAYQEQVILASIPCNPITKTSYIYQTKTGDPQSYRLYALLSNSLDPSIEKAGCLGGCGPNCFFNYGVSSMNIGLVKCSYVCAPGNGGCEKYQDADLSLCPKKYFLDSTCNSECGQPQNRCQNASGKYIPY